MLVKMFLIVLCAIISASALEQEEELEQIPPGFNFCGPSNRSVNGELGWFEEVDRCCKQHDDCGNIFLSWKANANHSGLKNLSSYTLNQCICDRGFYECLDKVRMSYYLLAVGVKFVFRYYVDKCAYFGSEMLCKKRFLNRCQKYITKDPNSRSLSWQLLDNAYLEWIE